MQRRQFLRSSLAALAAAGRPLRFGHRQASMGVQPGPEVFNFARRIPGLAGVELQVHYKGASLWDRDTLMAYQRAARQTKMEVPSLAGIWKPGATILQPGPAEESLRRAAQAAELIGAKVILVAFFAKNCPQMDDERSYGPVVEVFRKVAPAAANAGVVFGIETSLSPAHDRKLIELVNHPAVRVYYDADNVERYGHQGLAIPGFAVLGKNGIAQVHLKNEGLLLAEPGRVEWPAALKALSRIGYDGWLVFESSHTGPDQCIEATTNNMAFVRRHLTP